MEKPVRASVSEALSKSAAFLFKPFSWRKWVKLIFIGWLAGTLSGGMNFSGFDRAKQPVRPALQEQKKAAPRVASTTPLSADKKQKIKKVYEKKYWFENSLFKSARDEQGKVPAWYMAAVVWPIIIVLVLLILGFLFFLIWLSSRFQFTWFHAIQFDDRAIGASFRRYSEVADSLMLFNITAMTFSLFYFAAIIIPTGYLMVQVTRISPALITSIPFMLSNFWPFFLLVVFSTIVLMVVYSIVTDFLVPLMATEKIYFMDAARDWMPLYKANRFHVWRYFMMKILASVLGGVMTMVLTVPVLLVLLLAAVLVFGPLFLILVWWLKLKTFFLILAVILGVPFLLGLLILLGACALPVSVFMRIYSLAFLSRIRPSVFSETPVSG